VSSAGTWKSEPGEVTKAVSFALKDGYRHIDAALYAGLLLASSFGRSLLTYTRIYGNEHEVGQGIRDSGVPREEIFITSKLWNTDHPNAKEGLQKTLDALGTDYLDLYVSVSTNKFLGRRLTPILS
jgi:glycerol 2-dehydrogenase (NADP+)